MSDGRSIVFDRAAGFYDATRGFPPGTDRRVAALFVEAGGLGPTSRVLEIGIGTGRIALPLAPHVGRITGVDLSAPMLAQLAAKRGTLAIDAVRADAAALPFRDARFDAVVAVHVFHLIPRWREVLAEVARVLRPDGMLLHGYDDGAGGAFGVSPHELANEMGYLNPGVAREQLETFPEEHGFALVPPVRSIRMPRRQRPQTLIDRMANRIWSVTWQLSDADLARIVESTRAELVARYGDLDAEVEVETSFSVRAYRSAGRRPPTR